jgi:hypothetical protein
MKKIFLIICIFVIQPTLAQQITGVVKDREGQVMPDVNVYIDNTYKGTTTNFDGVFKLEVTGYKDRDLVFKHLGYKTLKQNIKTLLNEEKVEIVLSPTQTNLDEVIVNSNENPAIRIIQNAIDHRQSNLAKRLSYKADFYSKGLWKVENVPEKILGQEVGDLNGSLDSTRSGIVYLSETVSKIAFEAPDNFKENIIASKISGNDNGFSFNSAQDFKNSFYKNTIEVNVDLVSPIADYAFDYYRYKLKGVFYEENGFAVNEIQVIPKRKNDKVLSGTIFIIDDSWELYGIDLDTTGESINVAPLESLNFKQNFTYNTTDEFWVMISQSFEFNWKLFGISGSGRFVASYNNYDFKPKFEDGFFSNEIKSFEKYANQKDSLYWQNNRPLPLTNEEFRDYQKKDSVQLVRNSKKYKDSVDQANNRFKLLDPIKGYYWQNSTQNISANYEGVLGFNTINFNTVQGFNLNTSFNFTKRDTLNGYDKFWRLGADVNYGFSDERFRAVGTFTKKFNNFSRPYLTLRGGVEATEINSSNTTSNIGFNIAAIFFEENFLKLYDRQFIEATYSQEVINGIRASANLSYQRRKALVNERNEQVFNNDNGGFTSNNPLAPEAFGSVLFPTHHILKLNLSAQIRFGQTYTKTPRGKYNNFSNRYPTILVNYQKGFGNTETGFDYHSFKTSLRHNLNLSRFGELSYQINGGFFLNEEGMSFLDFKHLNGNQTRVNRGDNNVARFNLLPYYERSTNQRYSEFLFEHNFEGFIMNRIPVLKYLKSNLILGSKSSFINGQLPYHEFSVGLDRLGFGKFRFLRLDYVVPYSGGWQDGAIIFGLTF